MKKKINAFLSLTIFLVIVPLAEAQQPKFYRVGVLSPGGAWYETIDGLWVGLKQLGFEEGKQFVLEIRDTKGDAKAAEEGARNFEQEKVDLIYTTSTLSPLQQNGRRLTFPSFSVPGPTLLVWVSWKASQTPGGDSQSSTT